MIPLKELEEVSRDEEVWASLEVKTSAPVTWPWIKWQKLDRWVDDWDAVKCYKLLALQVVKPTAE